MANITYLIGAGASANALPVVSDMKNRMQFFLNFLYKDERGLDILGESPKPSGSLIKDIIEVHNSALLHATPDTYAKKLYLKGDLSRLRTLKFYLSLYFLFEQANLDFNNFDKKLVENLPLPLLRDNSPQLQSSNYESLISKGTPEWDFLQKILTKSDSRYDVFLATLLESVDNKLILPSNVNIISWNYDIQFELAYCDFDYTNKLTAIENLNVFPITKKSNREGDSKIVKLNGMAGLFSKDENHTFSMFDFDWFLEKPMVAMKQLIKDYSEGKRIQSFINFAWEANDNEFSRKAIEEAQKILFNTDALVIIGYSFPNFNKQIDRKILGELGKATGKISKVYYQAHPDEIEALCKNFHWLMEGKMNPEPITDLKQFFIPPEFVFLPSKPQKGRGIKIRDFSEFRQ